MALRLALEKRASSWRGRPFFSLFVMIGFAAEDSHGTVELFDSHEADHLMGESHLTERYLSIRARVNLFTKAVRTTDNEREILTGRHFLLQEIRIFDGAVFMPMLIEQQHIHGGCQITQDRFSFRRLELVLTERFGILDIRKNHELKRHIVFEPLLVFVYKGNEAGISRLPRH